MGDDGLGRERDEVVFTRREIDESDARVGESMRFREGLALPKGDTHTVQGGEVGSERRPGDEEFCPLGVGLDGAFGDGVPAAPVNLNSGVSERGELVSSCGVREP